MSVRRRRIAFSSATALLACVVAWIVTGQNSPLAEYFLYHTAIPNTWMVLHVIPYLFEVVLPSIVTANHLLFYVLVALQWMLIGYVAARLVYRK